MSTTKLWAVERHGVWVFARARSYVLAEHAVRSREYAGLLHRGTDAASPPAFADGPVADTAEPVAAEAGRPIPEPDRDDTHTMGHD